MIRSMLTPKEVAALLAVDRRTVRRLTAEGKLRSYRVSLRCPRYRAEEVEQFLRECGGNTLPLRRAR